MRVLFNGIEGGNGLMIAVAVGVRCRHCKIPVAIGALQKGAKSLPTFSAACGQSGRPAIPGNASQRPGDRSGSLPSLSSSVDLLM